MSRRGENRSVQVRPGQTAATPAHRPAEHRARAAWWLALAVGLALAGLEPAAGARAAGQCIGGCKQQKRECVAGARAEFQASKAACAGSGRKACRRTAKRVFKHGKRACSRALRRECRPCCRSGKASCGVAACGDGRVDGARGERCDGTDLGGATCESLGLAAGTLACLADCSDFDTAGCGGTGGLDDLDPADPGGDYVEVTDPAAQQALIDEMWRILTAPSCWDASAALPVGNVSQFQFYGQFQYRHFGFSTNFGPIVLYSVGHYRGWRAAIVETWTGVIEGLVILDGSTIAHVFPNPEGTALVVTRYGASAGPCL